MICPDRNIVGNIEEWPRILDYKVRIIWMLERFCTTTYVHIGLGEMLYKNGFYARYKLDLSFKLSVSCAYFLLLSRM